jgi:hypothetical protein
MAHIRQSRPDSGLGLSHFQCAGLCKTSYVPSSLSSEVASSAHFRQRALQIGACVFVVRVKIFLFERHRMHRNVDWVLGRKDRQVLGRKVSWVERFLRRWVERFLGQKVVEVLGRKILGSKGS